MSNSVIIEHTEEDRAVELHLRRRWRAHRLRAGEGFCMPQRVQADCRRDVEDAARGVALCARGSMHVDS